jgi:hypothetical protein
MLLLVCGLPPSGVGLIIGAATVLISADFTLRAQKSA